MPRLTDCSISLLMTYAYFQTAGEINQNIMVLLLYRGI